MELRRLVNLLMAIESEMDKYEKEHKIDEYLSCKESRDKLLSLEVVILTEKVNE